MPSPEETDVAASAQGRRNSQPSTPLFLAVAVFAVVFCLLGALLVIYDRSNEMGRNGAAPSYGERQGAKLPRLSSDFLTRFEGRLGHPDLDDVFPSEVMEREAVIAFADQSGMEAFLTDARKYGVEILGIIPGLLTARIGFSDRQSIRDLFNSAEHLSDAGLNYVVRAPQHPSRGGGGGTANYEPFLNRAAEAIGIPHEHSHWGKGIRIAVLDTGVEVHASLNGAVIEEIDLLSEPSDGEDSGEFRGHGTAVTSLLVGQLDSFSGIVPSAEILSVRVLDGTGSGDTFTLAQGIVEAVDRGSHIISMSLGTYADSFILREAIDYAREHNVTVVASAGNDGYEASTYPARYDDVIGVTAVDATRQRAEFSNFGPGVDIAAPGVGLTSAWSGNEIVQFSGTSAAAPIAAGAVAALLSQELAAQPEDPPTILLSNADDTGIAGEDPFLGHGIVNVERMLERNQRGIYDAAVSDLSIVHSPFPSSDQGKDLTLVVSVQNRGTEPLSQMRLEVEVGNRLQVFYFSAMEAGEADSQEFSFPGAAAQAPAGLEVHARVSAAGLRDMRPENNEKTFFKRIEE